MSSRLQVFEARSAEVFDTMIAAESLLTCGDPDCEHEDCTLMWTVLGHLSDYMDTLNAAVARYEAAISRIQQRITEDRT